MISKATAAKMKKAPLRVIALRDRDTTSLAKSASGGAFPLIARPILKDDGVVFGSELLSGGIVRHTPIESINDLPRLQGSKYVQSDIAGTFSLCYEKLCAGRTVLYSGTPCQIYALRTYLVSKNLGEAALEKLYTIDLVCHGVTSPALFQLYISWLENRVGAIPGSLHYEFRSKQRGWGLYYCYHYTAKSDGKTHSKFGPCDEDPYYAAFLEGRLYRTSCYSCRFACPERVGDFTIGDYWGIENAHPEFDSKGGVSLLLINSEKGMKFFSDRCEEKCDMVESTIDLAIKENQNLKEPTRRMKEDVEFSKAVSDAVLHENADLLFGTMLKRPFNMKRIARNILPENAIFAMKKLLRR